MRTQKKDRIREGPQYRCKVDCEDLGCPLSRPKFKSFMRRFSTSILYSPSQNNYSGKTPCSSWIAIVWVVFYNISAGLIQY
jgi:hypothetical protein